jgi:RimJ/RimL family protein N-acetyltransferase
MNFEKRIERIVGRGFQLEFFLVPWDTEILGFPVAQIERIEVESDGDPASGMEEFSSWLDRHEIGLASCRLASDRLRESMLLEANGFRFIEMVYSPVLSPIPAPSRIDGDLGIAKAQPEDLPGIEGIAESAFATSRYILDWRLDGEATQRRYRVWVQNSFADPRHEVLKATIAGDLVGFFIVEDRPDAGAYWHLTAIAPTWQGKGIGRRLWGAMVARHHAAGQQRIETTISAHNAPVLNIYTRLGFKFDAPRMTFHWVRQ